ncbi:hypothetical protein Vafri_17847, partial [Volvox africanus]
MFQETSSIRAYIVSSAVFLPPVSTPDPAIPQPQPSFQIRSLKSHASDPDLHLGHEVLSTSIPHTPHPVFLWYHRTQLVQAAVRFAEQTVAHPTVQQVGAAALQLGASYAAFNLTLALTHVTAGCLRIHCNTPLLAPLWGAASVAAASVAAGH